LAHVPRSGGLARIVMCTNEQGALLNRVVGSVNLFGCGTAR
jgi:hypothetical protein